MSKRAIYWLFACAAIMAVSVPINEAVSQPLPMVECKGEACTMSKADWEKLREFHKAVREYLARVEKKNESDNQALPSIMQKLQSCMAILEERKV